MELYKNGYRQLVAAETVYSIPTGQRRIVNGVEHVCEGQGKFFKLRDDASSLWNIPADAEFGCYVYWQPVTTVSAAQTHPQTFSLEQIVTNSDELTAALTAAMCNPEAGKWSVGKIQGRRWSARTAPAITVEKGSALSKLLFKTLGESPRDGQYTIPRERIAEIALAISSLA